jgi:hypothetical protein
LFVNLLVEQQRTEITRRGQLTKLQPTFAAKGAQTITHGLRMQPQKGAEKFGAMILKRKTHAQLTVCEPLA